MAQHILGQVDQAILQYYQEQWPDELEDFCPSTTTDPCKALPQQHHQSTPPTPFTTTLQQTTPPPPSPLEMIIHSYVPLKKQYPEKEDKDLLTAIVLFYYSTVVLEYYALNDAEQQEVFLTKRYVSEDKRIIVTQDDQIFLVLQPNNDDDAAENPAIYPNPFTSRAVELRKLKVKNTERSKNLRFQTMSMEERTITLRLLSRKAIDYDLLQQPRYYLNQKDPKGQLLKLKDPVRGVFSNIIVTIDGFFRQFQNKETNYLLFQITTCEEPWASTLRRRFYALDT